MAKGPQVGDPAPDFELAGTQGSFRLSEHRGKRVVLLFYPGDDTMVCTRQFCSYRDHQEDLSALQATVVGISTQGLESHEAWTAKHGLTVPLLADPDAAVCRLYGAYGERLKMAKRAVVIVDERGVVAFRHDHRLGLDFQRVDELAAALASLPQSSPA